MQLRGAEEQKRNQHQLQWRQQSQQQQQQQQQQPTRLQQENQQQQQQQRTGMPASVVVTELVVPRRLKYSGIAWNTVRIMKSCFDCRRNWKYSSSPGPPILVKSMSVVTGGLRTACSS